MQTLKQLWDYGLVIAAHQLGRAYRDGLGVLPYDEKAELWFRHSAEAENDFSQCALGTLLLEQGRISAAISWYERAAEAGNQYAQYHVGTLYLQGNGIPRDIPRAKEFLTAAAEQGNLYAQYALGKLYLSDDKIPQNKEQAAYWLAQSAAQGHWYAQFLLDRLDNNQSPSGTAVSNPTAPPHEPRLPRDTSTIKSNRTSRGQQIDAEDKRKENYRRTQGRKSNFILLQRSIHGGKAADANPCSFPILRT